MILALISPHVFPAARGNAVTVRRIELGLRDRGVQVRVVGLDGQAPEQILETLERIRPDAVHGFHATAAGPTAVAAATRLRIPAVITLTGTDVNQDLAETGRRPRVLEVLRSADAVTVFHDSIRALVRREAPDLAARIRVVPQAVRCEGVRYGLRERLGLSAADCVFFQPAGVRRVKNISAVIPMLSALQRDCPTLRYVLAGPVIEAEEGARVAALLRGRRWAVWLDALSHEQVCGCLPEVDVVLNSSLSEGGMSNAVLEAMSRGVPVLASDIAGNRSIVLDGEDGFLYGSEAEFLCKAERLLHDPALRSALGDRGRAKIAARHRPEDEIDGYLALYRDLIGGRGEAEWI